MDRSPAIARAPRAARRGFALLAVVLVLLALLLLTAPFLMTARNASKSSARFADRVQADLALDSALREARSELSRSHPDLDDTPYWDDLAELTVEANLDPDFVDRLDDAGVMWAVEAEDLSGRIDLNSAGPQLCANVIDGATRLTAAVKAEDQTLPVSSTWGFPAVGFLWLDRELVGYTSTTPSSFEGLQRGLLGTRDAEDRPVPCGPQPARAHEAGTVVLDQRAFAPALWRIATGGDRLRRFESPEQLRAAEETALGPFEDAELEAFARCTTPFGDVRGGRRWQRPVRATNDLQAGRSCVVYVDERRWFNPGTTVLIRAGCCAELGIVEQVVEGTGFRLMNPVVNDYGPYRAEVLALARRPVNANVAKADTLRLLFQNLQRRGVNERVTRGEAEALAELTVASRPFAGMEDFLRRVLLPAAGMERLPPDAPVQPDALADGATIIDPEDAVAVYANALNANDSRLEFSTLPLCFVSREVFDLEARAAVHAPSGIERVADVRRQTELIAPQQGLLALWASQEDFDEALRLDRESPWWASGPEATSQYDGGASPPSRLWPQLGTSRGHVWLPGITAAPLDAEAAEPPIAEHVFPSRDEHGFVRLWAARRAEVGRRADRMFHFDHETRDAEGRFLPDEPLVLSPSGTKLQWADKGDALLRPLGFSLWLRPRDLRPGVLLDVGKTSLETDRVTLAIEDEDLVLRVLDGPGDHPDTPDVEAGEVRFALAGDEGPGLEPDTWSHVEIDVGGNRPDQLTLLVDGRSFGVRTPGLSELVQSVTPTTRRLELEDGEGFPDRGVVRIGRELVEYVKSGPTTLDATHHLDGPDVGFGGRFARPPFLDGAPPAPPVDSYTLEVEGEHAAGTPVEVMGYSIPLASNVPSTFGTLAEDLGTFAVAQLEAVEGVTNQHGFSITEATLNVRLGTGLGALSPATGLVLEPVDGDQNVIDPKQMMKAFSTKGGYAALVQVQLDFIADMNGNRVLYPDYRGNNGEPLFGVEIIRYSGYDGTTLRLAERTALPAIGNRVPHAFVANWEHVLPSTPGTNPTPTSLRYATYVVPVSVAAPGFRDGDGLQGKPGARSGYAQLTHDGADFPLTEWVRYDMVVGDGTLVRNDPRALQRLSDVLTHYVAGLGVVQHLPAPGGGGGNGGIGGGGVKPLVGNSPVTLAAPPPPSAPPLAAAGQVTAAPELWQPIQGAHSPELLAWHLSQAAQSVFQFRGVCGTPVNPHSAGTVVLPVFRVDTGLSLGANELPSGSSGPASLGHWSRDWDNGWPGRNDAIFLVDEATDDPGTPATIHRVWRPRTHLEFDWHVDAFTGLVELLDPAGAPVFEDLELLDPPYVQVALTATARLQVPATLSATDWHTADGEPDTRRLSRIVKHPSGERPREVEQVVVGGDLRGANVPAVTVDELLFQTAELAAGSAVGPGVQGAPLVLTSGVFSASTDLRVRTDRLRTSRGKQDVGQNVLDDLPEDGGLMRLGRELLCVDSRDPSAGTMTIAEGGRGLLGTVAANHEVGTTAQVLESFVVSTLAARIGAGDDALPLVDTDGFPDQGLVLVEDELIHYTRIRGDALEMPRASSEPGAMDGRGDGILRGRFGTVPADHPDGVPVILFPFRYWDRQADRADGPELAYLGLALDQPGAFVRSVFWEAEETAGTQLEVLQRAGSAAVTTPPWDAEPDGRRLWSWERARPRPEGNPVDVQGDLFEWRVFVRYLPGAFDARTGLSHAWKRTPRLTLFGVDYLAPNRVLGRAER